MDLLCSKCGQTKDENKFYEHRGRKNGRSDWCQECSKEDSKLRYQNRIDKRTKKDNRQSWLKANYRITEIDYQKLFILQEGKCAICKIQQEKVFDIDHDHLTGEIRGLLCHSCNLLLGGAKDNIEI